MANHHFIGSGLSFPLVTDNKGNLRASVGEENIQQSIRLILGTAPGERLFRPDFGCRIHDLLFEPNTELTAARVEFEIKHSLEQFEPRIKDVRVVAEADAGESNRMNVSISYIIRSTNVFSNMVYPFYLKHEE